MANESQGNRGDAPREHRRQGLSPTKLPAAQRQAVYPNRQFCSWPSFRSAPDPLAALKLNQSIANPLELLAAPSVTVYPDGELAASHSEPRRLIRQLDLNSPALIRWRVIWLRIVDLTRDRDPSLYRQLIGFPDLPDLTRLRPPTNNRHEGIEASWHARKLRGELPAGY